MFKINIQEIEAVASTMVQEVASEVTSATQGAVSEALSTTQQAASNLVIEAQQASSSVGAATITAQEAFKVAYNIKFENLPRNLQLKFARAGVRQGIRNFQEAARIYETIPAQIRAQGY